MAITDRLAYIITTDPSQGIAGFGRFGKSAQDTVRKVDAEMARLQKRIDQFERQALRSGRAKDPLGADVARIKAADLRKEMEGLQAPATGLRARLAGVGVGGETAAVGLGIASAATLKLAVDAAFMADRLETAQRATPAIFGKSADAVKSFAADADSSLGLTENKALSFANAFGNVFRKAGANQEDAARFAQGFTTLGSVLSRANPEAGDTEQALTAIQAALRGEFDPLERFKVKINATTVEQKALRLGLADTTAGLTEHDKVLATTQLLYEQTRVEQGLFVENSGTLAANTEKASAALQDMQTALGGRVKDDAQEVAMAIATLNGFLERFSDKGKEAGDGANLVGTALDAIKSPLGNAAKLFNHFFPAADKSAEALESVKDMNIIGRDASKLATRSTEEQATSLKKVAAAAQDRLQAAQALVDADDKVLAAQKAVAEASDDEAEKAEAVADAQRDQARAATDLAAAEDAVNRAIRDAPQDRERAAIAARDAAREQADAQKEYEKVLRRRGAGSPKEQEARDKLALATLDAAQAQQDLNDLQGKSGLPKAVEDAIRTRDDAMRTAAEAEKRTAEALAVNPYEAQAAAAADLRQAEQDRLAAVSTLNEKMQGVSAEIRAGFDATVATRAQVEGLVGTLQTAVTLQRELAGQRAAATSSAAAALAPSIGPDIGMIRPGVATTTVNGQFNGPITVQASDPNEMARRLALTQRIKNLVGT